MVCDGSKGLKSQLIALFYRSVWPGLISINEMPLKGFTHCGLPALDLLPGTPVLPQQSRPRSPTDLSILTTIYNPTPYSTTAPVVTSLSGALDLQLIQAR